MQKFRLNLYSALIFQTNICKLSLLLQDTFHFEYMLICAEEEEEAV